MKVTIGRAVQTSGLFKKTTRYTVNPVIEFDNVEQAIIKQRGLGKTVVFTTPSLLDPNEPHHCTISDFVKKTDTSLRQFPTIVDADNFEHKLRTDILPTLKEFIMSHHSTERKSESFEL